jgi:hypothetical protein
MSMKRYEKYAYLYYTMHTYIYYSLPAGGCWRDESPVRRCDNEDKAILFP